MSVLVARAASISRCTLVYAFEERRWLGEMNSKILWQDKIPDRDGQKSSIKDIAISPG